MGARGSRERIPGAWRATTAGRPCPPATPSRRVAAFIARFEPAVARLTRGARRVLRRRFSTAFELVYDNYNALAIAYASTDRASGSFVNLAVFPAGVLLGFYYGAGLPDPHGLLRGSGSQFRSIRLTSVDLLDDPRVVALVEAAVRDLDVPLPRTGRGPTIVKSVSARQRPRRPVGAASRPTSGRRG